MEIFYGPQSEAEKVKPDSKSAMISIISPGNTRNFRYEWKYFLPLQFNDITVPEKGLKRFSKRDADKIKDFVKHLPKTIDRIIVHCEGGISRSAGVAKYLSEKYGTKDYYGTYNYWVYGKLKQR